MFSSIIVPVTTIVNLILPAALTLVGSLGMLYCIVLGVKYAKAEEAQDKDKAKGALKNAIIGYILIFVLIAVLTLASSYLTTWLGNNYVSSLSS